MLNWVDAKKRNIQARGILSMCEMILPPIDIYKIARAMNIDVYVGKNISYSSCIKITDKTQLSIHINYNDNEYRRRFAVAHAIGHVMLHELIEEGNCYEENSYTLKTQKEDEANKYAMGLLIPLWLLEALMFRKNIYNVEKLCDIFLVPSKVMSVRMYAVGGVTKYLWEDV